MGGPKWKREVYPDHKFDFIDVKRFKKHSFLLWAGYLWVYIELLKSVAVYVLDTQTAIFLLAFNKWASTVKPAVSLSISRWIFSGCIIFSFLLLAKDWWTAKKIIRSRDISFAYTNLIANRWYCVRGGYSYFCLFDKLGDSRHAWDSIAFFVFFSFKGWKRLLLAEGPRQVLNAITLYSVAKNEDFSLDIHKYQLAYSTVQGVVMSFMVLTVAIWVLSMIRLVAAGILYWPLLVCHIRGNLKEYCCHKVDKKITKLLAEMRRKRTDIKAEQKDDSSDIKNQPTLPKVDLDEETGSTISMPMYPLSRTDTIDSRRALLTRTDSTSTIDTSRYLARSNTETTLGRTNTMASNQYSAWSDTSSSRSNTGLSRDNSMYTLNRAPTLPHMVGDFSVPEVPRPTPSRSLPRIDTRVQTRSPPPSAYTSSSYTPMSAHSYAPPTRTNTNGSTGYLPPSRGNSYGIGNAPRRPERPYSPPSDYGRRGYATPR